MFSFLNKQTASKATADAIAKELHQHNQTYRSGEATLSDSEYDAKVDTLRQIEPQHPYLHMVEAETLGSKTIKHDKPMLSTQKAYTETEIHKWLDAVRKAASAAGIKPTIRATAKLDGIACKYLELPSVELSTRGDGLVGNQITKLLNAGLTIVGKPQHEAVGEIVMPQSYFDQHLKADFSHPRNFVAGVVNADTLNPSAITALQDGAIHFVLFKDMPSHQMPIDDFEQQHEIIEVALRDSEYPIDGVVYEVIETEIHQIMGSTSHHNNWVMAKKQKAEEKQTTVLDVQWSVGRSGVISPVVHVEPVLLSGAMTAKVTGHHAGNILNKGIGKGAVVSLFRAGEVIPFLSKVNAVSDTVSIPTCCPSCGGQVEMKGDQLYCAYPKNCVEQKESTIIYHFSMVGALLFGKKTVQKIVANGFDSIESVYGMSQQDFTGCGLGEGQASNLLSEISRVKSDELNDFKLAASLGISNFGRGSAKKVLAHYRIEELAGLTADQFQAVEGFGELTSISITNRLQSENTLPFLLMQGFNLIHTQDELAEREQRQQSSDSVVSGKNVVFTGTCSMGRGDMENWALSLGCTPQKSVNGQTDYLICGEKVGQSKMDKARAKGVSVLTESEFRALTA